MKNAWKWVLLLALSFVGGCDGCMRSCAADWAETTGADWLIVQYDMAGEPFGCWIQRDVSVTNEDGSDGIYWKSDTGHLVHVSGWYNRVQVDGGDFAGSAALLGVDPALCINGKYGVTILPPSRPALVTPSAPLAPATSLPPIPADTW